MTYSWINLLILFGALQALVFSIILLFQRRVGSGFLAAFVFIIAYNGFETFNWSAGLNSITFDILSYILIFAIGPALYLHTRCMLRPKEKISRGRVFLHLIPFLFQLATRLFAVVVHILFLQGIIMNEAVVLDWISFTWTSAEPFSMLLFLVYVAASIRFSLQASGLSWRAFFLTARPTVAERWIRSLLAWCVVVAVAWAVTLASPLFFPWDDPNYYPVELLLVAFAYWLVLNGYHKMREMRSEKEDAVTALSISADEANAWFARLTKAMAEQKLYLDPKLNLSKLSAQTGVPAKVISNVLNQHHQVSFSDFVNRYRIEEVCRMLGDPVATSRFTLSAIALECGFNSQATFQRVFKNMMGVTPGQYVAQPDRQSA